MEEISMKKPIISILSTLAGAALGAGAVGKVSLDKTKKVQSMSDKHLALFLMMNQWVKVKQEGKGLAVYFETNGYKKIAIYGMSYAGETLVDELKNTGITVAYGIDKRADSLEMPWRHYIIPPRSRPRFRRQSADWPIVLSDKEVCTGEYHSAR